ncbi:Penicillin-binding protein 1B, partial [Haemophilus influenzae]
RKIAAFMNIMALIQWGFYVH